ncbi:MAG: peptidase U32 family protein [Candidatus Tantalella remota]|nr:peptidase U32 family protein [Candidatus Tantalella remota]
MFSDDLRKPELLAPAGDWSSLNSALTAGADAVYFGVKGMNMRHAAKNFDILEMKKVMDLLHTEGKKGYLALNVIVYDNEIDKVRQILTHASEAGVDALILWDMAVFAMAKELGLKIHLSTQASAANFEAVKHFASMGARRVVLARECALTDIGNISKKIKENDVDCEIETFIHGAMCVSLSGRCFLSQESFGRSANRGDCLQPCRREFTIRDETAETEEECSYVLGKDYILSPRDLCTIEYIDRLIAAGIGSFKIEGRMRPPEYVKTVTSAYREAIDAFFDDRFDEGLKKKLLGRLKASFNRGFSTGFYFGRPDDLGGVSQGEYKKIYLGEVTKFYDNINVAEIKLQTSSLAKGQTLLFSGKKTPALFVTVNEMQVEHEDVEVGEKGSSVGIKLPFKVKAKDKVFLWEGKLGNS